MFMTKWYQIFLRSVTPLQCFNLVDFMQFPNKNIHGSRRRELSLSSSLGKNDKINLNYYETLEIDKNATQSDVKAAYYKMSMQYHPDKNKGSEIAAEKFRDVSEAYEVLGNFRLRKLYDKGIIHTAGSQYAHHARRQTDSTEESDEELDPQTKFYKSRMRKSTVPPATGRTPIYDFDEWSRAHYGSSFERRQAAKERYERRQQKEHRHLMSAQKEMIILGMAMVCLGFFMLLLSETKLDTPKRKIEPPKGENS